MNVPYLNRYRNGEYLQYMKDILELVNQQDTDSLQLSTQKDALETTVSAIDAIFQKSQGSAITQEIIALDERRDKALIGIRSILDGYTYHYDPAIATAAQELLSNINAHGDNIARMSYQEQTAVTDSVLKDTETKPELVSAVSTLTIGNWFAELRTANTAFNTKYLERVNETAASDNADIPQLRLAATAAYRTLVTHVEAHKTLSGNEAYAMILKQISVLAGSYNQVVDNRSTSGTTTE